MKNLVLNYKFKYFVILILALVTSFLNILGAFMLSKLLDAASSFSIKNLFYSTVIILIIWSAYLDVNTWRKNYNAKTRSFINNNLKDELSAHIISLSNNSFEKKAASEYLAEYTSNIEMIDRNCIDKSFDLVYCLFTLVLSFASLSIIHYGVAITAIIMFLVMSYIPKLFQTKLSLLAKDNASKNDKFSSFITDYLYGRNEFMQYNKTIYCSGIQGISNDVENARYLFEKKSNYASMVVGLIGFIFQCVFISLTAFLSIQHITSIGTILVVGNLAGTFTQSASTLFDDYISIKSNSHLIPQFKKSNNIRVISEILPVTVKNLESIIRDEHTISFAHLSFNILNGKKYYLKGNSGSGKSTLLKTIFTNDYEYHGTIKINNIERKDITSQSLENDLAYIPQKSHIFHDTIRFNLCMGNDLDDSEIIYAIHMVQLDDFFAKCNNDLNYVMEDDGTNISGGEKQRLCLARALLSKRKFIILDEAFSAVDQDTTNQILDKLLKQNDITLIVTGHNISNPMESKFDELISLNQ